MLEVTVDSARLDGGPVMPTGGPVTLTTERLVLRPLHPDDAALHRRLWGERDPRVPPQGHAQYCRSYLGAS